MEIIVSCCNNSFGSTDEENKSRLRRRNVTRIYSADSQIGQLNCIIHCQCLPGGKEKDIFLIMIRIIQIKLDIVEKGNSDQIKLKTVL